MIAYANPAPVSLRARLLRLAIRWTIGRAMQSLAPPDTQRRQLLRAGALVKWLAARGAQAQVDTLAGLPTITVRPRAAVAAAREAHLLYLHGGGYVVGAASLYVSMTTRLSRLTGACVHLPDYRLAPEHPFPAAVDDALAAYRALLDQGVPASRIVIGGDSAGGGLTLACALAARDAGLPQPAGLICYSPWTDLTVSGASVRGNAATELVLDPSHTERYVGAYLPAGMDARTPLASPLFADLRGLAPIFIQVAAQEVLLDDSTRLAEAAQQAGVPTEIEIWNGVWHVWQAMPVILPEADAALARTAAFMRRVWGLR